MTVYMSAAFHAEKAVKRMLRFSVRPRLALSPVAVTLRMRVLPFACPSTPPLVYWRRLFLFPSTTGLKAQSVTAS